MKYVQLANGEKVPALGLGTWKMGVGDSDEAVQLRALMVGIGQGMTLIDTAEFQRLRRIRQLGLAHFAYQAAEHSRFTHSLGAFHLATRVLARLRADYQIKEELFWYSQFKFGRFFFVLCNECNIIRHR